MASVLSPLGFSYYASTNALQPDFYQSLLDLGWRRSGRILYKPDQRTSCCPQYTIRLDADSFHASKDQRQVLNRFNKYIVGEDYAKETTKLYPMSREQAMKRNTDFDLLERVHGSENEQLRTPPEPAHSLLVTLEHDEFTEEKYSLFENYQRTVHHEPPHRISKHGFKSFLCSSPLPRMKEKFDGQERRLGSFHQCYRIDGKLVAIGVLDLLPQCVSAVYFMYDESVHQHGFGKLGALREIALAKEDGYRWWYAGFYIHNCVKMKYKGEYRPQYILDPETYSWNLLDEDMKKRLDVEKFVSSSQPRSDAEMARTNAEVLADPRKDEAVLNDKYDSDEEAPVPLPDLALFARPFPGILTKAQLLTDVDLDHIKILVQGLEAETCDLIDWELKDIDDPNTIKSIIAELVAAVGIDLANKMIVTFD